MHYAGGQARLADPVVKFAGTLALRNLRGAAGGSCFQRFTPNLTVRFKSRAPPVESLGFLMQTDSPKSKSKPKISNTTTQTNEQNSSTLDSDQALAALRIAVQNHDYSAAEFVFDHTPALQNNAHALELVIRNFCNMNDFTTAKAVLLQVQEKLNEQGFMKFMIACFRHSENADDLHEVFESAMKQFPASPLLAATALFGFKVLQDQPRSEAIANYARDHMLTPTLPFLQVQIYDNYIRGDYMRALELGREVKAKAVDGPALRQDFPYRWALRYFAQHGDAEAIEVLQAHMAELRIVTTSSFSNIVLASLPLHYPSVPLVEWLKRCKNWGWPLDQSSFVKLARILYRWYPSQQARISENQRVLSEGLARPAPQAEDTPGGPELSTIQKLIKMGDPGKCLYVLDSMRRRGMVPPYYFHVLIFEALCKHGLKSELEQLVSKMKAVGYPKHCAGTDLAMLELQLREAAVGKNRTRSEKVTDAQRGLLWVNQYLLEYPLVQHNLSQLTRIAKLFMHCGQPEIAAQVVNFLRWQSESGKFAAHNHDSRSLALLISAEVQCGRSPEAIIDTLLADRPRIFIDLKLKRRLRELLAPERRQHYTTALKRHNEWVINDICRELNELADFIRG